MGITSIGRSRRLRALAAAAALGVAHVAMAWNEDALQRAMVDRRFDVAAQEVDAARHAAGSDAAARGEVLRAALELLAARERLDGPEGEALRGDLAAHAAAAEAHWRRRDALLAALAAPKADAAVTAAAAQAVVAAEADGAWRAEALDALAWVAWGRARGGDAAQGERFAAAADAALAAWRAQPDLHARRHEFQLLMLQARRLSSRGDFAASIERYAAAAAFAAPLFGADSVAVLDAGAARASDLESLGRYGEERDLYEDLLRRARAHLGEGHAHVGRLEAGLGAMLAQIGDYPGARRHYEVAERLLAQAPDVTWGVRLLVTVNFANALQESGDGAAARERQLRALGWIEAHPALAFARPIVLANLGNTEFGLRRYADAEAHFREALAAREKLNGAQDPGLAFALEGLGSVALVQQRYAEAAAHFERALGLREPRLPAAHPMLNNIRFGLALARWGEGERDRAFALAVQSAEEQQRLLAAIAADYLERQSLGFRDKLVPATALVVTLAAKRGDADSIATAWRLAMGERGLIARTQARRLAAARAARDPASAAAWQRWRAANTALAEAWLGGHPDAAALDALRAAADAAAGKLGAGVAAVAAPPTLAALAQALPAQGRLFAVTEGLSDADLHTHLDAGGHSVPQDWYAFGLDAGGVPSLRRLGRIAAITADAQAWYETLRDPRSALAEVRRRGEALRGDLFGAAGPGEDRTVFFVPDGALFRLDLAALPLGEGFAVERGLATHVLSHEADLLLPAAAMDGGRVLLAGASDFPAAGDGAARPRQLCLRAPQEGFTALASAARELDGLADLFRARGDRIERLSGADATRERVLAALPQARVVHVATHGFSLDASCAASDATRALTLQGLAADGAVEATAPALSGLAFSGARLGGAAAPGVLSDADLAGLDLGGVAWIALSACDSGLGPVQRGEGVFGMRRALRLAGARTVLMSLWEVDDEATAALMAAVYRQRFGAGRSAPDALAAAMRETLAARRAAGQSDHPYYWAAFVAEGGWR